MEGYKLSKEKFIKYLNILKEYKDKDHKFTSVMREFIDGDNILTIADKPIEAFTGLISDIMGDVPDDYGTLLDWWLWEDGNIVFIKGEKLDISDPGDFYDFLINR